MHGRLMIENAQGEAPVFTCGVLVSVSCSFCVLRDYHTETLGHLLMVVALKSGIHRSSVGY